MQYLEYREDLPTYELISGILWIETRRLVDFKTTYTDENKQYVASLKLGMLHAINLHVMIEACIW